MPSDNQQALLGTVVGYGRAARDAAALYASLTARTVLMIDELEELVHAPSVDVVVTTTDDLTPQFFDLVTRIRPGFAPGVIFGERDALHARCVASARLVEAPIVDERRYEIVMETNPERADETFETFIAQQTSTVDLRRTLAAGAGLLVLQTHCDGVDAKLSDEAALCARLVRTAVACGGNRCDGTDWCHRFSARLSDPSLSARLIGADIIAAGVLLFDSCWALLPPADIVDPRHGLGAALARNLRIHAMAAPWRVGITSPDAIFETKNALASGIPLGVAIGRHNQSVIARMFDHVLCVFGDPMTRLAPSAATRAAAPLHSATPRRASHRSSPIGVIRHLLASPGIDREKSVALRAACEEGGDVDRALMEFLCASAPRIDMHWTNRQTPLMIGENDHHCLAGAPPLERIARFRVPCGDSEEDYRILGLCQRCGVAEDRDPEMAASVEPSPSGRRLLISGAQRNVEICVVAKGQAKRERRVWPWPRAANGKRCARAPVPQFAVPGIGHLSVIIVADGRFSLFSFTVRGMTRVASAFPPWRLERTDAEPEFLVGDTRSVYREP